MSLDSDIRGGLCGYGLACMGRVDQPRPGGEYTGLSHVPLNSLLLMKRSSFRLNLFGGERLGHIQRRRHTHSISQRTKRLGEVDVPPHTTCTVFDSRVMAYLHLRKLWLTSNTRAVLTLVATAGHIWESWECRAWIAFQLVGIEVLTIIVEVVLMVRGTFWLYRRNTRHIVTDNVWQQSTLCTTETAPFSLSSLCCSWRRSQLCGRFSPSRSRRSPSLRNAW